MTQSSEPVIELTDLVKLYPSGGNKLAAVDQFSATIGPGLTVLSGPSGCGKSTLINLIGALDRPSSGGLRVAGQRVEKLNEAELDHYRRHTVGIVFQFFHLVPTLTVLENVALPAELAGVRGAEARSRAAELLDRVGMSERSEHRPHQLSGGEIQRTAICRALINRPSLVLADEPTGNLDSASSERVMEIFARLIREEGASALVATHDPDVVTRADRVLRMLDGKLTEPVPTEPVP